MSVDTSPTRALVLAGLVVLSGCAAGVPGSDPSTSAADNPLDEGVRVTVTHVTDGDTMDVRFPDGRTETVRLLGVDTPEVHAETDPAEWEGVPETAAGDEWLRGWGEEASEFAAAELDGATVSIRTDPRADRRGGYGRLLVYLRHPDDDRSFNRLLVERGYARLYDAPFSRLDAFAAAERAAREAGAGVWGFERPTATATAARAPVGATGSPAAARGRSDAVGREGVWVRPSPVPGRRVGV